MKKTILGVSTIFLIFITFIILDKLMFTNHFSSSYTLTITGHQLQKQVDIPPDQLLFDVIARGNSPFASISFELENDNINGWIDLDRTSNKATLQRLEVEQGLSSWAIYIISPSEENHATYQIHDQISQKYLNLQFHHAPIYYHPDHAQSQNVHIFGQLQFQIPKQWAALQLNRFPKLPIQGQFIFDGKPYTIIQTNTASTQQTSGHHISYFLTLKHQDERINFSIEQDSAFSQPLIRLTTHNQLYEFRPSIYNKIWMENDKHITITAKNLVLTASNGQTKQIHVDLVIPKNYANLSINNRKVELAPANSDLLAEARNEQKIYLLYFYDQNEIVTLKIIEEEAGHFSLQYGGIEGGQYECGDHGSFCTGLTVHANKQNFYLNQIKFGKHILNGEIFIAGVL